MYGNLKNIQPVRTLVGAALNYSGVVPVMRWWGRQRSQRRPRLIILNYHRASGKGLRGQLLYLRRHYRLMPLEQALEELWRLPEEQKHRGDRRLPLVVTFDDGYQDNYTHLFPLACELHVPVTIFLIPGYLDSGAPFWWREGARLARCARVAEATLDGCTYRLAEAAQRPALAQAIDARLRYATSVAEREAFLARMCQALAVSPSPDSEDDQLAFPLNWAQVREMAASGWVSFGAHTLHHPVLACLRDPAEVAREVGACRPVLEQQLGLPIHIFAFPIGKRRHIGDEALQAVKEAGYSWALTTIEEAVTPESDPYLLPRLPGVVTSHWLVMASELAGLPGIRSGLLKLWGSVTRVPVTCRSRRRPRWARYPRSSFGSWPVKTYGRRQETDDMGIPDHRVAEHSHTLQSRTG
jgi:peptidoglycan/xylan/chitin deacetylase (PgdA/CDA1 family)